MIQDIEPYMLDNQYTDEQPKDDDIIFFFKGSTLLGKVGAEEDEIVYPTYKEFVQGYKNESDVFVEDDFEFTYLFMIREDCADAESAPGNSDGTDPKNLDKYDDGTTGSEKVNLKKLNKNDNAIDSEEKKLKKSDMKIRFFLARPNRGVDRGAFIGEMADSAVHDEYESCWDGFEFIGVNRFRIARPKWLAYASITAFHLYGWYRDNVFCGRCGAHMKHGDKERMMFCPECKNTVFPKICPAVIVAVTDGDKILLTKYAGRTYKNYALVAGFTEIGETVEQTVIREVKEEVGLNVRNLKYYKSQPWGLSGSLLYGYYCEVDGDNSITLQEDELSVGEWVSADEIDTENDDISLTREMIVKFAREHKKFT